MGFDFDVMSFLLVGENWNEMMYFVVKFEFLGDFNLYCF